MAIGCCWEGTGGRWRAAGNPGWSVRPRLRNHPKIMWIEAACQERREGSCQGEPVLAGVDGSMGRRAALGAGGMYVGTGMAPFRGDRLPQEVASLFLPPCFQGRGEAGPVPASWKCH